MKRKQIVFTQPYKAELLTTEVDENLQANQMLVRLVCSTISSGTERANLVGEKNVSVFTTSEIGFPRCSGYSSAGIVEKIGSGVTAVAVGDRVSVSWSTHSKYVVVKEHEVHKIEFDDISMSEAALVHIATFPMLAIRKCELEFGEPALVMGFGVLGMIGVKLLRAAGAYPIVVADLQAEKREEALKIGADYAFDPTDADFAANVKKVTYGGAKVVIEVTGNDRALDSALDCCAKFARVALLGCTRNSEFAIDYYHKVHGPGINLIGMNTHARPMVESTHGMWTTHDDAMAILRMVHGKRLDLVSMVAETHSPMEAEEVYNRLATEKTFPVVQFDWDTISGE